MRQLALTLALLAACAVDAHPLPPTPDVRPALAVDDDAGTDDAGADCGGVWVLCWQGRLDLHVCDPDPACEACARATMCAGESWDEWRWAGEVCEACRD